MKKRLHTQKVGVTVGTTSPVENNQPTWNLFNFFKKILSERKHGESLSLQTVTPYVISYNVFVETEPKADLQVASNGQPGGGP